MSATLRENKTNSILGTLTGTFDLDTGVFTEILSSAFQIAFGEDGVLYAHNAGNGDFFTVDTTDGSTNLIFNDDKFTDLAGTLVCPQACVPAPSGLVSWWDGDSVSGTTATDIQDGNDGTLMNGATTAPGKVGDAFILDGVGDYVFIGNPPNLQLTQGVTVDAWVFYSQDPVEGRVASIAGKWGITVPTDAYVLSSIKQSGIIKVAMGIGDGSTPDPGLLGGVIPVNTWTHVAGTYDASTGQNIIYVNGAPVASRTRSGGIFNPATDFLIGAQDAGSGVARFFPGLIDEVKIYNRALSASEIQAIYKAGTAGKCKPDHYLGYKVKTTKVCEGGVSLLTLQYNGTASASVVVTGGDVLFGGTLYTGDPFDINLDNEFDIVPSVGDEKLDKNVTITADGEEISIHTSCSQPIYPDQTFGPGDLFTILEGKSLKGGDLEWAPGFEPLEVTLTDQFEIGVVFEVKKPDRLYNPADKNDEGINDPKTHLVGYKIKRVKGQPKYEGKTEILVEDQFGQLYVDVKKPDRLLVPSLKDLYDPVDLPDPFDPNIDHFKCYKVKVTKGTGEFPEGIQVTVVDQFDQWKWYDVKKPSRLCIPVDTRTMRGSRTPMPT